MTGGARVNGGGGLVGPDVLWQVEITPFDSEGWKRKYKHLLFTE